MVYPSSDSDDIPNPGGVCAASAFMNLSAGAMPPIAHKKPPPPEEALTPGDWLCGHCGEHNFSNKLSCFSCRFPGPKQVEGAQTVSTGAPPTGPAHAIDMSRRILKEGDWMYAHDRLFVCGLLLYLTLCVRGLSLPARRCGCGYHNFGTKNPVICGNCPEVRPSARDGASAGSPPAGYPGAPMDAAAAGYPEAPDLGTVAGEQGQESVFDLVQQQIQWHLKRK